MRKSVLLSVSLLLFAGLSSFAQSGRLLKQPPRVNVVELEQQGINMSDVSCLSDGNAIDGLAEKAAATIRRHGVGDRRNNTKPFGVRRAEGEAQELFAVAQSFHSGYTFNYAGGDVYAYNISITREGSKVTINNLFDMEVQSAGSWAVSYDLPVEGVYDEAAKTITIPSGTVCGDYGGYYDAILNGGTVSENGSMTVESEIVFDVEGDLEGITARKPFAAQYQYGTIRIYKSFTAAVKKAGEARLITFASDIAFGETFVGSAAQRSVTLINTGGMEADYVVELESDDDSYTVEPEAGTVPAGGTQELVFTLLNEKAGEYEGIGTLTYDTGSGEDALVFSMLGTVKDYPDYSPIVKEGDFSFKTNMEYPFELSALDDGTVVAQSGTHGNSGTSQLDVCFTVPEGKLATFAWKGASSSSLWYIAVGGYFVDDLSTAAATFQGSDDDISNSLELAAGDHVVRFQYDSYRYNGLESNKLYVYDLKLTFTDLAEDAAELMTPEVNMGNFILKTGVVEGQASIVIRNKGANPLTIGSITSNNDEFTPIATDLEPATTLNDITVTVAFESKTAGMKQADITIETSAGTLTTTVKAEVMDMPDFASLVTEGAELMTFDTDNQYPFVVADGKAWNKNCTAPNDVSSTAWFSVAFTIPEGKIGHISWDGEGWGDVDAYDNYAGIYIEDTPRNQFAQTAYYGVGNGAPAGSAELGDYYLTYLDCIAGYHEFRFTYYKSGFGGMPEGNKYVVSNIRLVLEDFEEHNAELQEGEVAFKDTYVGPQRYTTATVTLKNTGSAPLEVEDIPQAGPFYGIIPTYNTANYGSTLSIELWFYPTEKGEYANDMTIKTNAGDFTVKCSGKAKDAADEGYIYLGDFEDDAYGWVVYDADGDGSNWNLGTNLWGTYYDDGWYARSGSQCLASPSDWYTPDNWAISPAISIPEEGADLSYYVAAFSIYKYEEHYSFYITEDASDVEAIKAKGAIVEETMSEAEAARDGWLGHQVSLDDYAGKTVYLCFRHHSTEGQYLLRLDDVNVMKKGIGTGIANTTRTYSTKETVYNAAGQRSDAAVKGLNIIRRQCEDGSVKTFKVIR